MDQEYKSWLRISAYNSVQYALRSGKIIKPKHCSKCKRIRKLEAHHKNYLEPLKIIWLCKPCHNEEKANKNKVKNNY